MVNQNNELSCDLFKGGHFFYHVRVITFFL